MKNNKKSRKPRKTSPKGFQELSPVTLQCSLGLLQKVDNKALKQQDLHTVRLVYELPCNTDGSGVLATVFGSNPSNCAGWSNLAAVYDEYRTLAVRVKFRPLRFSTGASTITLAPIASALDYDTATAFASYASAALYSSFKEHTAAAAWTRTILMSGAENAQFFTSSSPTNAMYIKLYSSNNTISLLIGRFEAEYYVQFRGKGI